MQTFGEYPSPSDGVTRGWLTKSASTQSADNEPSSCMLSDWSCEQPPHMLKYPRDNMCIFRIVFSHGKYH